MHTESETKFRILSVNGIARLGMTWHVCVTVIYPIILSRS